ncbi:MAG: DUF86 domain-containing protein [Acidobacteriota bacterium]
MRALEELEGKLRRSAQVAREEFLARDEVHDLAEHYLHLAVECMADVASHVVAERGMAEAETYRRVFELLAEASVITPELASRLAGWAGFRNVLVHMYVDVDHGVSWRAITEELDDLTTFRRAVATLLA